jgi:hypothetical protein
VHVRNRAADQREEHHRQRHGGPDQAHHVGAAVDRGHRPLRADGEDEIAEIGDERRDPEACGTASATAAKAWNRRKHRSMLAETGAPYQSIDGACPYPAPKLSAAHVELRPQAGLDPAALAETFRRDGRLQIVDFLRHDGALALFRQLAESREWRLAVNKGETDRGSQPGGGRRLARREEGGVRPGGDRRWPPGLPVPLRDDPAARIWHRIGTGATAPARRVRQLSLLAGDDRILQDLTGAQDIALADGHASRYQPGHFLTAHDDTNVDMGRRAAYVLNLTPQWRPDWGGVLQFYDERGNIVRGFIPAFNTLNIFRVPQPHSVSWVHSARRRAAPCGDGWLRAREYPGRLPSAISVRNSRSR